MLFWKRLAETPAPAVQDVLSEMMAAHTELDRLGIPAMDPDTGEALSLGQRVKLLGLEMAALKQNIKGQQLSTKNQQHSRRLPR